MLTGPGLPDESMWEEVRLPYSDALLEAAASRDVAPLALYYVELDTNDPVQRAAFSRWLVDPMPVFSGALPPNGDPSDVRRVLERLRLPEVTPKWKAVTTLRNHHKGLNPRINMLAATVSQEEETVYTEVYKQRDNS